ncbi:MBOAT family protein [Magnetospira sp. QH-2]|uniref:MBOAT family O-acyltransferase n=1 Tax=Magnetospira sp. (strain QH-2) TaxID=1288970 RepID=UPI0003E81950|nr:MBOAT family O-acyltransferase [Magnetospira sp. QH-2]CCQ75468.1 putative Alginate o-acetyltransferase [Magnetospira sp. QH-2]
MIFNQFAFLFIFLPVVLTLFFLPGLRSWRAQTLIAASLVFYGLSGIEHALVLCADVVWVYFIVTRPAFQSSRPLLFAAILPPVLALGYYKYLGFLLDSVLDLSDPGMREQFSLFIDILLPAGISFFTFQVVSFAIDRYRGEVTDMPSFSHFAAYISLFPQLVAGPILRYRDVAVALRHLGHYRMSGHHGARAVGYICLGLAVKVLIADTLGYHLADYRNAPGNLSQEAALYTIFAYSFQIYFDFYGYSMIAIGLGALFGFSYPHNFKRPYDALNPRDFWRRWHITLSYWIRDYLYIPLGGNRAYARNIFIVMALCGLWHGAGWSFVVWGLYHAGLVAGYHYGNSFWDRLPAILQRSLTFTLVSLGWLLFLYDFNGLEQFLLSLGGLAETVQTSPTFEMWIGVLFAVLVAFGVRLEPLAENNQTVKWKIVVLNVLFSVLFVTVLLFLDRSETFIYFRF